jgi:SAM-dependent methyltransferase
VIFFETRYDGTEVSRLYDDYCGELYLKVRHRFEPWYTRQFNKRLSSVAYMEPRRRVYRRILGAHADMSTIVSVLDYAGDRGQMMAGGPGRDHFVFDVSGVTPVQGVTNIADEGALAGRVFDLVRLCGVVEHFSEPLAQLKRVLEYVKPGGLLYVEVPDERFNYEGIPRGHWYRTYLEFLTGTRLLLLALDFWSTGMRIKFGLIPPLGFAKQHEHLNYFDRAALLRLVMRAGLTTVVSFREGGALIALCRRPDDQQVA